MALGYSLSGKLPFDDNSFDHVHIYRVSWGIGEMQVSDSSFFRLLDSHAISGMRCLKYVSRFVSCLSMSDNVCRRSPGSSVQVVPSKLQKKVCRTTCDIQL